MDLANIADPIVLGFPGSTYVHIVRLILTHKGVPYTFRDLEPEMGSPTHLALHPFNRVPILQHGDFTLYETSAIATYIDEAFDGVALQPSQPRERARMQRALSEVPGLPSLARNHGGATECATVPSLSAATGAYRARAKMARLAQTEILSPFDVSGRRSHWGRACTCFSSLAEGVTGSNGL